MYVPCFVSWERQPSGHDITHRSVRIDGLAEAAAAVGDGGERAGLVNAAGVEQLAHARERVGANF
jgi:hypothetical protein